MCPECKKPLLDGSKINLREVLDDGNKGARNSPIGRVG